MSLIKGFINSGECPGSKQEESLPGRRKQVSHSVLTIVVGPFEEREGKMSRP